MKIKSIFVLGSTSLIAKELCLALAEEGCRKFHLIAKDSKRNNFLVTQLRQEFNKITKVNYLCLVPWLMLIANSERINKESNLWVFSSVAADRGRPSNYIYGAAKAGLSTFCEGLIAKFHGSQFKIRLIKPGYMLTPMSEGKAPKFLCIQPKIVAIIIIIIPRTAFDFIKTLLMKIPDNNAPIE